MGRVYHVEDLLESNEYALKTLRIHDPGLLDNLRKEYRNMMKLSHPNLVKVYDFDISDHEEPFFVMELVKGNDLFEYGRGRSFEEILPAVMQVLQVLDYIHSKNYVHCDLKPSNILSAEVEGEIKIKLTDLGLMSEISKRGTSDFSGTPAYSAPEVLAGGRPDEKADLFSLGVTIFQTIKEHLPERTPDGRIKENISWDDFGEYRGILAGLLEKDPDKRIAGALQAAAKLNKVSSTTFIMETESAQRQLGQSPYIGRRDELNFILESIKNSFGLNTEESVPETNLFAITGEIGIGKTRFINELQYRAKMDGVLFLSGEYKEDRHSDLDGFKDILRRIVMKKEAESLLKRKDSPVKDLVKLIPDLKAKYGIEASANFAAKEEKLKIFETLRAFLDEFSGQKSLVICLDDMHSASPEELPLLEYLALNLRDAGIVFIFTGEENDLDYENGGSWISRFRKIKHCSEINLKPLESEELKNFIFKMLGLQSSQYPIFSNLEKETRGNPLYIEVWLRALIDLHVLARTAEGWKVDEQAGITVDAPESMESALEMRLKKLRFSELRILQAVSIFAETVDMEIFKEYAAAVGIKEDRHLSELLNKELLRKRSEGLCFDHPYTRRYVYGSCDAEFREICHLEAAKIFEKRYLRANKKYLQNTARHYLSSSNFDKALHYGLTAADNARENFDNSSAEEFYKTLLLMPLESRKLKAEIMLKLIETLSVGGKYSDALALCLELEKIGAENSHELPEVSIYKHSGDVYEKLGSFRESENAYRQALSLCKNEIIQEKAIILDRLAVVLNKQGRFEEAVNACQEGLNILEREKSDETRASLYNILGMSFQFLGKRSEAIEQFNASLEIRKKINDVMHLGGTFLNLGNMHYIEGETGKALEYYLEGLKHHRKCGHQNGIAMCLHNTGHIHMSNNRLERALKYYQEAYALARRIGNSYILTGSLDSLGSIHLRKGNYKDCSRFWRESLEISSSHGDSQQIRTRLNLAFYHYLIGKLDSAERSARSALEIARNKNLESQTAWGYHILTMIAGRRGNFIEAEKSFKEAEDIYSKLHAALNIGNLYISYAFWNIENKRLKRSEQLLEKAKSVLKSQSSSLFDAQLYLLEAKLTDPKKAMGLLRKSAELAANDPETLWQIHLEAGKVYHQAGMLVLSARNYQKAVDIVRELAGNVPSRYMDKYLSDERRIELRKRYLKVKAQLLYRLEGLEKKAG